MSNADASFARHFVIVGDRQVDKTGVMYETALARVGIEAQWLSLRELMGSIVDVDGSTLLEAALVDPTVVRVNTSGYSISSGTFDIHPGSAVVIVNNEFDAYAWVITRVLDAIGAVQPNGAHSLRAANNKWMSHVAFREAGLPVAQAALVREMTQLISAGQVLGFPVVVKELEGAQGTGVRLAHDVDELIACAEELGLFHQPLMIEHYIEIGSADRRVVMIDGQVAAAMERHAKSGDFRANLAQGGFAEPYEVSNSERTLVARAVQALGLRFVGMDLGIVRKVLPQRNYLSSGKAFIIEANPMPGLAGLFDATGVDASNMLINVLLSDAAAVERPVA